MESARPAKVSQAKRQIIKKNSTKERKKVRDDERKERKKEKGWKQNGTHEKTRKKK
jgi:hypothetical protein